jgi:hypothetical protein
LHQPTKANCDASELEDKLYVVLENSYYTISRQSTNARWYALAYGQSGLQEVKGMASRSRHRPSASCLTI